MEYTYGWRKTSGGGRIPLMPHQGEHLPALLSEPVYHDNSPLCVGCPYPRHGLMCSDGDGGNCLRTDIWKLEAKWREEKQKKAKCS